MALKFFICNIPMKNITGPNVKKVNHSGNE